MARATDIARYFLLLAAEEPEAELLTQMRLHKLLYYAQGWSLATLDRPLFQDQVQAWQHGPVVRAAYPAFADYDNNPIAAREADDPAALSDEDRAVVRSVWAHYKRFSATELRSMTHREAPWREARRGLGEDEPSQAEITREAMRAHFERAYAACAEEGLELDSLREAEADLRAGRGVRLSEALKRLGRGV